jgi:hypothetical protein
MMTGLELAANCNDNKINLKTLIGEVHIRAKKKLSVSFLRCTCEV